MADALAHGADPGWVNAAADNRTPLLQAVAAVTGVFLGGGVYPWVPVTPPPNLGVPPPPSLLPPSPPPKNSLLACEFLLQNGASVNQSDSRGRGPLHHATMLGHTGCVPVAYWEGGGCGGAPRPYPLSYQWWRPPTLRRLEREAKQGLPWAVPGWVT